MPAPEAPRKPGDGDRDVTRLGRGYPRIRPQPITLQLPNLNLNKSATEDKPIILSRKCCKRPLDMCPQRFIVSGHLESQLPHVPKIDARAVANLLALFLLLHVSGVDNVDSGPYAVAYP
jgi:hypothetical protein